MRDATENLARAVARRRGVRLVHVSSLAAIGPSLDGAPVAEDAEPHPLTHYGKSKLEAERIVKELVPDAVIVRPPVVYGPRDTDVFQFLRSISKGLVVQIAGGERWFSAIYVKDWWTGCSPRLALPALKAGPIFWPTRRSFPGATRARPRRASWGGIRASSRLPLPVAYAVGYCAEVLVAPDGKPGIVSREKVKEALCSHWTCDTRRAAQELGFEARTPLEAGIADTLAWYKEAGWLTY